MSSVTEGLGTSLLDAMACSRAIVATRTGGIPEIVEDGRTGVLVEPRDHRAMAREIVRLLTDERLCASRWETPVWRVSCERFTVERMVAATADVYARVAGTTPRSGHCASPCARLKPHAFIIPTWQSEKSYLIGSAGSSRLSELVMSCAMRQPGLVYFVRRRHGRPE